MQALYDRESSQEESNMTCMSYFPIEAFFNLASHTTEAKKKQRSFSPESQPLCVPIRGWSTAETSFESPGVLAFDAQKEAGETWKLQAIEARPPPHFFSLDWIHNCSSSFLVQSSPAKFHIPLRQCHVSQSRRSRAAQNGGLLALEDAADGRGSNSCAGEDSQ